MAHSDSDMDLLEEGGENNERWLLTYSDMITLLLALFIILYSISTVDATKFKKIAESMNAALNNPKKETSTPEWTGGTDADSDSAGSSTSNKSSTSASEQAESSTAATTDDSLDQIAKNLKSYINKNNLDNKLKVVKTEDYVRITLLNSALFEADKSVLLSKSKPLVDEVASVLISEYSGIGHITISGHTANYGPDNIRAWALSSDRAIAVLTEFVDKGMKQSKFSVEGASRYDPVAPNDTETNMAKNRRVEITITKTTSSTATSSSSSSSSSSSK